MAKYQIITSGYRTSMNTQGTELVELGYKPIGGVSITLDNHGDVHYAQAFYKEN